MSLYEVLKASKTERFPDYWTLLWGRKLSGKMIKTLTGSLPLTFTAKAGNAVDWSISGNDNTGKNLLELGDYTTAAYGIYRINMGDGKLHIYGKSTNQSAFRALFAVDTTLSAGTYTITGTLDNRYRMQVLDITDPSSPVSIAIDDGQGADFTLTGETPIRVNLLVRSSAYNLDVDMVITPMLRLASTSSDFEPYQIGVGRRTTNFIDLSEISSETRSGVTFTVDRLAGTVTVDGTNTSDSNINFRVEGFAAPPPGKYYFTGCPDGGTSSTYYIIPYDVTESALLRKWNGTTATGNDYGSDAKEVLITDTTVLRFTIRICAGYTANNLVFKPFLWLGDLGTTAPFMPYGYQIPLAVTCDRNLFNIYGNMAHTGGVHTIDFNVETSSITGEMSADSYFILGFANAIVKGDETFVISFDKTTAGTAELRMVKGEGSAAEVIETFDISAIKSYRIVFECEESFGNVYPRLVATEAATQTFEHIMIKKASDKGGFVPYGAKYEYNVLIDAPLTAGQSVSDTQTIEVFEGENTIDTTLYNKPTMEIKYK